MQDSDMKLPSNKAHNKSISVFVRITPEMNHALAELAKRTGGGVATVMRMIVENALADGVTVEDVRPRRSKRPKANETVEAATTE
jgi:hypothetical protein